jgi:chaperonin GroES
MELLMSKKVSVAKLKPFNDRFVVSVSEPESQTPGGIILPDAAKQKPHQGVVIAVGPGLLLDSVSRAPMSVAVGDTVLFGKYSGVDVEVNGTEFKVLREDDVLGKLEE